MDLRVFETASCGTKMVAAPIFYTVNPLDIFDVSLLRFAFRSRSRTEPHSWHLERRVRFPFSGSSRSPLARVACVADESLEIRER